MSASAELFERLTRRYGKPTFGLDDFHVNGAVYPILEEIVWAKPFCNLLHFARPDFRGGAGQPKLLIVAPMSGHYATLLRGTVEAFLPHCDVYITDWADARMVPLALGPFDLDDYIDYLREMLVHLARAYTRSGSASLRCPCSPPRRSWRPTAIRPPPPA